MTDLKIPEGISRPFANYDIVVYLGAALFSLPFINRYVVEPFGTRFPNFNIKFGTDIASEAVAVLSSLFTIYILGHIIAYISSQVIEKTADIYLGKVSSAMIISGYSNSGSRNELMRGFIFNRLKKVRGARGIFVTFLRTAIHIPALPAYAIIFLIGIFGHYDTRVSRDMWDKLKIKFAEKITARTSISIHQPWYKALEYYVINKCPASVPRMYNYLVISGLFRSLSLIFLFSAWCVIYFIVHWKLHGDWLLKPLLSHKYSYSGYVELSSLVILYTFCLFSYIKFQRRYAEEAIFAFIFQD